MFVDLRVLAAEGPQLGRPQVDTLKNSRHSNMKELRTDTGSPAYRTAFAFDPNQEGIVLCAGDKNGRNSKTFYRTLIATADDLFDQHLVALEARKKAAAKRGAKGKKS